MGKKIKFLGSKQTPEYHGYDGDEHFSLERGQERLVSDAKAAQVAEDFPHLFEVDGKKPPRPKSAPAPEPEVEDEDGDENEEPEETVDGDDPKAELLELSLDDLAARATKLGVEGVGKGKLRSKAQLADAIVAKLAETREDA